MTQNLLETYGRISIRNLSMAGRTMELSFDHLEAVSGHSVPRGHIIDPHQGIQVLYKGVKELPNVTIHFKCSCKKTTKK